MEFFVLLLWIVCGGFGYELTKTTIENKFFEDAVLEDDFLPIFVFTFCGFASMCFAMLLWVCWDKEE